LSATVTPTISVTPSVTPSLAEGCSNISTSSLTGWNNSGATIVSGTNGNAINVNGNQWANMQLPSVSNGVIDAYVYLNAASSIFDLFVLCNSSGAGYIIRLDSRSGFNQLGIGTCTSMTGNGNVSSFIQTYTPCPPVETQQEITISYSSTVLNVALNGTTIFTINNPTINGSYFGVSGDTENNGGQISAIQFCNNATPVASLTPTPTVTPTISVTPSVTPSITVSTSLTPSITVSTSATPSPTVSVSPSSQSVSCTAVSTSSLTGWTYSGATIVNNASIGESIYIASSSQYAYQQLGTSTSSTTVIDLYVVPESGYFDINFGFAPSTNYGGWIVSFRGGTIEYGYNSATHTAIGGGSVSFTTTGPSYTVGNVYEVTIAYSTTALTISINGVQKVNVTNPQNILGSGLAFGCETGSGGYAGDIQYCLGGVPTPTPTATPTLTPTPTVSVTHSVTPSVTPTISVTSSVTPSITVTPSVTITVTPSITPSST
jgi:hypothetical protein